MDDFVSNVEIKPGESLQLESENVRIQAMDWHPDVDNGTEDQDLKFTVPNQYDLKLEEDVETALEDGVQNKINDTLEMTNMTTTIRPQEMPPKVPVSTAIIFHGFRGLETRVQGNYVHLVDFVKTELQSLSIIIHFLYL